MRNLCGKRQCCTLVHVSTNKFATITSSFEQFKTFSKFFHLNSYILCRSIALKSAIIKLNFPLSNFITYHIKLPFQLLVQRVYSFVNGVQ